MSIRKHPRLLALVSGASLLLIPIVAIPLTISPQTGPAKAGDSWSTFATTSVYAADGSPIAKLHGEVDREPVALADMSPHIRDAVIAIEDRRFFTHNGLDPRGIARAAVRNLRSDDGLQGGSTISQQLVKNVFLREEPRQMWRKAVEAVLAFGLEKTSSKEEILEAYLNTVYFGRGVYGVQAASRSFFHKDVADLTLAEAAYLAGLIHMPVRYDWANSDDGDTRAAKQEAGRQRRDVVLRAMREQGFVRPAAEMAARRQPLEIHPPADDRWDHPYFIDAVLRELGVLRNQGADRPDERFDFLGESYDERAQAVYQRGLRIHTTLSPQAQRSAEEGLAEQLPQGTLEKLSAALVSVEPGTGYVRALIGGRNYYPESCDGDDPAPVCRHAKVNLALGSAAGGSGRHAGSSFKPFVLAAALEDGVSLRQQVSGSAFTHEYEGTRWKVSNYDGDGAGNMTIIDATVRSVNAAFARLEIDFLGDGKATKGSRKVAQTARKLGLPFETPEELKERCGKEYNTTGRCTPADNIPAIALGAKEVSPLHMAAAYAAFAAEGVYARPTTIAKIEDARGNVLYEAKPERRRALKRATALGVSHVLEQAIGRGTGRAAALPRPAAGKTGTSQQWRDAWFAGYVPQLATAVWVGNPMLVPARSGGLTLEPMTPANGYPRRVTGGSYPARIWGAHMSAAVEDLPVKDFPEAPKELFKKPKPPKKEEEVEVATPGVPNVVGMSRAAAQIALNRAGFSVSVISACPPGPDRSGMTVWRQSVSGRHVTLWAARAVC